MSKAEKVGDKGALLQGTLDLLVLRILAGGPKHGFAISRRLRKVSDQWLQVDAGSLYPGLYRMEGRGCIRSEMSLSEHNRQARYCTVTKRGEEELKIKSESGRQFSDVVYTVLKKG